MYRCDNKNKQINVIFRVFFYRNSNRRKIRITESFLMTYCDCFEHSLFKQNKKVSSHIRHYNKHLQRSIHSDYRLVNPEVLQLIYTLFSVLFELSNQISLNQILLYSDPETITLCEGKILQLRLVTFTLTASIISHFHSSSYQTSCRTSFFYFDKLIMTVCQNHNTNRFHFQSRNYQNPFLNYSKYVV